MAETVRCAVVGCGVIAPTHLSCLAAMPNAAATWVCDLDRAKAEAVAPAGARVTTDAAEVFAARDVDAVHVCTDHASHAGLAAAALAAGKHVLCEKPLAASPEGLARMRAARAAHPAPVFAAVFQHRFEPMMRAFARIVAEGALGTLATVSVRLRCERTRDYYRAAPWRGAWATEGGSVLINQAIHFFDLMLFIAGPAADVRAAYANRVHTGPRAEGGIETEDTVVAAMRLQNGALASFEATSASHLNWAAAIELHGHDGTVEWRDGKVVRAAFRRPDGEGAAFARRAVADAEEEVRRATAAENAGKGYYGPGHPAQIADFVAAIRERRAPFVPVEAAAKTMDAVFAVYRAGREGGRASLAP